VPSVNRNLKKTAREGLALSESARADCQLPINHVNEQYRHVRASRSLKQSGELSLFFAVSVQHRAQPLFDLLVAERTFLPKPDRTDAL
jgi:hypothetical protein